MEAGDEGLLRGLHRVLMEVRVMEGRLVCPTTGTPGPRCVPGWDVLRVCAGDVPRGA